MKSQRQNTYIQSVGDPQGEITLFVAGRVALDTVTRVMNEIHAALTAAVPTRVVIDLSRLEYLDSAGAAVLLQLANELQARSVACELVNLSEDSQKIMELLDKRMLTVPATPTDNAATGIMVDIGRASLQVRDDFVLLMMFLGELIRALGRSLANPRSVRWPEVLFYMKRAGVDGLPIVGLISLLVGLIIAFMSSLQLKPFGGNVFVASLVSVAIVKELGPLMTAIIVAGRSGSAFAAEIGTMIVHDEVDALVTMGFDPFRFLVVPKVMAAMCVVPLLTLYADLFGILGGLIVGVTGLDLTVFTYIHQTQKSIHLFDITASLVKSVVFAGLIAGIGCHRGFRVRGGAESVGAATTSAVVSAIFLIVVADSAFAIILHYIR